MTYDKLNRLLTKTGPEGLTRYTYDNAINGKGQIESVIGPSPNNIRQSYEYDGLGNLVKLTKRLMVDHLYIRILTITTADKVKQLILQVSQRKRV
jgi:uncharacterized protein RhaS with RHS repeats